MTKISVYMITYNNIRTVEKALKSLSWADEIIVVDSVSSDGTAELAEKYATVFKSQPFLGFQKQYQMASGLCSNKWRFFLDADEVISPEMVQSIQETVAGEEAKSSGAIHGFYGNRQNFYLGRWIKHGGWKKDRELRLYNSDFGDWVEGLHSCLTVKGELGVLSGLLKHYPYADISGQLATIDKYSGIDAQERFEKGKKMNICKLLLNPPWRFFRDYLLKLGFLDGFAGFVIAVNTAFYVFIKSCKLYELQKDLKK